MFHKALCCCMLSIFGNHLASHGFFSTTVLQAISFCGRKVKNPWFDGKLKVWRCKRWPWKAEHIRFAQRHMPVNFHYITTMHAVLQVHSWRADLYRRHQTKLAWGIHALASVVVCLQKCHQMQCGMTKCAKPLCSCHRFPEEPWHWYWDSRLSSKPFQYMGIHGQSWAWGCARWCLCVAAGKTCASSLARPPNERRAKERREEAYDKWGWAESSNIQESHSFLFVVCNLFFLRKTGAATDELEQPAGSAAAGAKTSSQRVVWSVMKQLICFISCSQGRAEVAGAEDMEGLDLLCKSCLAEVWSDRCHMIP